jgi:hypothetical protein
MAVELKLHTVAQDQLVCSNKESFDYFADKSGWYSIQEYKDDRQKRVYATESPYGKIVSYTEAILKK